MSIWRDHVTVILQGYIKYIDGIEYKYFKPDCAQMAAQKNRHDKITKHLKAMNYLRKNKTKKAKNVIT